MKTIGLLGGMSWESTAQYYRLINEGVKARLGGLHSAKMLIASVDFAEIAAFQRDGAWDDATALLARHARALESAGADLLLICANTMHKIAPGIEAVLKIPLLHGADVTAAAAKAAGYSRPGLLGTRFTMEEPFYGDRLRERHHLAVLTPAPADRAIVHRIIYEELCRGQFLPDSREHISRIIRGLAADGADSVILGCTELPLLIGQADAVLPILDTTLLHAQAAVEEALR